MRIDLRIIGIGPGDPRQVTVEAIDAMNEVDLFIVLDKGQAKQSLIDLRQEICRRYITGDYRMVEIPDPPRDRHPDDYDAEVRRWHAQRATLIEREIAQQLPDGGVVGFLVWGDPALYDSTLRIVDDINSGGSMLLDYTVIPGITSLAALTAAHRIPLNRIGEPIVVTTGRRLAQTPPQVAGNQVVMLDADCAFMQTARGDDHIYWGAYLGTDDEIVIEGPVSEVGEEIVRTRAQARDEHGWILDIYLIRSSTANT